ncbi:MAG: hypothetical protein WAQ28_17895 [Bacteroidia bacterium]
MKKKISLLICLLNGLIACAGNIDSILFSTDGKFVLIIGEPVWGGPDFISQGDTVISDPNQLNLYNIEFNKFTFEQGVDHPNHHEGYVHGSYRRDSVFAQFFNYNNSDIRIEKQEITGFLNKYELKLKGVAINKLTNLKLDTLNIFKVNGSIGLEKKEIDHFVVRINLIFNNQVLFSQIFIPAIHTSST